MTYILLFIALIAIFYFRSAMSKKIDQEEAEALSKDGHATFIRSQYKGLVEEIEHLTKWPIGKERDDAVFIRKTETEYVGLLQHSGRLSVVYVYNKQLVQKWEFAIGTSNTEIIEKISHYVKE